MFKLKPLEWLIAAAVFLFYGFAVFAVTRDWYIRHPVRPAAPASAQSSPHGGLDGSARGGGAGVLDAASAIPDSISQSDPELLGRRADELLETGRYEAAIPLYRRVLELRPGDASAGNDLGLALHYTGRTAAALEVLRETADANPDFQRLWLTLGFVTLESGDRTAAVQALARARELGPGNPVGQEAERLLGLAGRPAGQPGGSAGASERP